MERYAKNEFGIQVVYHPHVKTMIEYESEIIRLLDATGLSLCFDTGHHAYANGNGEPGDPSVPDFIRKYAEKIAYLHFKQMDGAVYRKVQKEHLSSDTAFDMDVMCDLPDGMIDFTAVRDAWMISVLTASLSLNQTCPEPPQLRPFSPQSGI